MDDRESARPGTGDHRRAGRDLPAEGLDQEPHHDLSNPVGEPDPTEWPDPYETRDDPRDPAAVDTPGLPADREAGGPAPAGPSTSEPHPERNPDVARREGGGDLPD